MSDTTSAAEGTTDPEPAEEGSTFLVALQVLMYTTLSCGLIAVMVVVMLTPRH